MYNKNIFLVYLPWRKKENLLKDSYKQSSAACELYRSVATTGAIQPKNIMIQLNSYYNAIKLDVFCCVPCYIRF